MKKSYAGIKKVKGKMTLIAAGIVTGVMAVSGCTTETVVPEEATAEEIVEVPEETTEEIEVIETSEPVEEVVEQENYSVEEVSETIDTYIEEHPDTSLDEKYIVALTIGANLDHISEEDLNTLLDTYGYSIEDLSNNYIEAFEYFYKVGDNYDNYLDDGGYDEKLVDIYYDDKFKFNDFVISDGYKEIKDVAELNYYHVDEKVEMNFEPYEYIDEKIANGEELTSEEKYYNTLSYADGLSPLNDFHDNIYNPYDSLVSVKTK